MATRKMTAVANTFQNVTELGFEFVVQDLEYIVCLFNSIIILNQKLLLQVTSLKHGSTICKTNHKAGLFDMLIYCHLFGRVVLVITKADAFLK